MQPGQEEREAGGHQVKQGRQREEGKNVIGKIIPFFLIEVFPVAKNIPQLFVP